MNTLRILYHLARADFLERVRRTSFLLILGLVVWIGYLSASGQIGITVAQHYYGIVNSAWIGAVMTLTVSMVLGLVGFYLVKGSVSRDYTTGVGQIMATTPLSRPLYLLGKWLSNFAVLGIMILIVLLEGILVNLLTDPARFDLLTLAAPIVLIALPSMALVAAIAVLFESVTWLRGGVGNILYFFLFLFAIIGSLGVSISTSSIFKTANPYIDFTGMRMLNDSISAACQVAYPECSIGINFGFPKFDPSKILPFLQIKPPEYFTWNGLRWTADMVLSRLVFLAVAVGLVLLSALFFDRFNPSRLLLIKRAKTAPGTPQPAAAGGAIPASNARLTPLTGARSRFRFGTLFLAELKLLLKGQRWWWYVIAALLVIGQLGAGIGLVHTLLLVAWVWPILLLSGLGCRENRFDTRQIVFAAPHPIASQLPASWLAAFVVTAAIGFGALIKFLLLGEIISALGWLSGAIFIPSLALFLGTLTGSSKAFEALFVAWMYCLTQKITFLDFMAFFPNSPWYYYIPLTLILITIAVLVRQRQLTARSVSK
jgi:ABC-type transport system involved in multi-copper enzyme maturation permease subunit